MTHIKLLFLLDSNQSSSLIHRNILWQMTFGSSKYLDHESEATFISETRLTILVFTWNLQNG